MAEKYYVQVKEKVGWSTLTNQHGRWESVPVTMRTAKKYVKDFKARHGSHRELRIVPAEDYALKAYEEGRALRP